MSVPTRYPEELEELLKVYDKKRAQTILSQTKEVWGCLKKNSRDSFFTKNFLKQMKIDKVVIFGSCVKGHFTPESDVDVAIVSRDFEKKDIFLRAKMLSGLSWALVGQFLLPFDIVPISLKEWKSSSSLVVEFVREGREF